jgi:hypothetical protein
MHEFNLQAQSRGRMKAKRGGGYGGGAKVVFKQVTLWFNVGASQMFEMTALVLCVHCVLFSVSGVSFPPSAFPRLQL